MGISLRYGIKLIVLLTFFTVLFCYIGLMFHFIFLIFAIISALFISFVLWFFRNPFRIPDGPIGILSPADGTILPKRGDNVIRIFMGLLDVHVNRAPCDGKIISQTHKCGLHVIASSKDADTNERLTWIFETKIGLIEIVQIAGFFARRIVPFKRTNDYVKRGEPIGMIKLGSRVDIKIPQDFKIAVSDGAKVYAGKTILASKK